MAIRNIFLTLFEPIQTDKVMEIKRMLLLLLGLAAATSAAAGPQKVKTAVEKVTLFIDGAQVTRTRQIDLPAGNSTSYSPACRPTWTTKACR